MMREIISYIRAAIAFLALFFVAGCVGGLERGTLGAGKCLLWAAVGLTVFALSSGVVKIRRRKKGVKKYGKVR